MSFGLALAGGGTKGAAHVGVLLALYEHNYHPSSIAGTSAGSIVAGLYSSGYTPHELKALVKTLSRTGVRLIDADYFGIMMAILQFFTYQPVTLSGLIKGNRLEHYLEQLTMRTISETNIKTLIPAVDINSGNTVAFVSDMSHISSTDNVLWTNEGRLSAIMRASSAIPAVFKPKYMGDYCFVDGGVTDVLPVDLLISAGEINVLAVDLSENYDNHHEHNIVDIASHSLSIMSRRLRNCTSQGERLLLRPKLPEKAGLLTFNQMIDCMEAGYEAGKDAMPIIKKLFS